MHPPTTASRVTVALAALALVVVLGACACFDPTIRFDLNPVAPAAPSATAATPTPVTPAP